MLRAGAGTCTCRSFERVLADVQAARVEAEQRRDEVDDMQAQVREAQAQREAALARQAEAQARLDGLPGAEAMARIVAAQEQMRLFHVEHHRAFRRHTQPAAGAARVNDALL